MESTASVRSLRIAGLYAVAAVLWAVLSTALSAGIVDDRTTLLRIDIIKDSLFGCATAVVIFALMRRDIQSHEAMAREKNRATQWLQAMADATSDVIFVKDLDGRYLFVNRTQPPCVGKEKESEVIGLTDNDLFPADTARFVRACDAQVVASGKITVFEEWLTRPDGERRFVSATKGPIRDASGSITGTFGVVRDLTEQRQAQEALRAGEERLQRITAQISDLVYVADENGAMTFLSEACLPLTGHAPADVIGRDFRLFLPPDQVERASAEFKRLLGGGEATRGFELGIVRKDGTLMEGEINAARAQLADRTVLVGVMRDISDRKRTERELAASEARFRSLLQDVSNIAVQGYSADGTTTYWNRASETIYGYTAEEAIGRNLIDLIIPPEMRDGVRVAVRQMIATGTALPAAELDLVRKDGSRVGVYSSHVIVRLPNREPELFCIDIDLTARREAEAQVRSELEVNKAIINAIPGAFYMFGADGHYVRWNSFKRDYIVGKTDEEMPLAHAAASIHPEDRDAIMAKIGNVFLNGVEETIEGRVLLRGGPEFTWMLMTGRRTIIDGKPYLVGCGIDIAERKRAEESLLRLATVIQQATDSVVITDTGGVIQYVNPTCERLTGYRRDELLGRKPSVWRSGHQAASVYAELWATITRGEVWSGHIINRRKDGSLFEEDATILPVRSPADRIVAFAAIKRDVTEQVMLRQQLQQAQKVELIGQLAGGVAHDFNNVLQTILGYCEATLARTPAEDPRHGDLMELQKSGHRAAELTQQLLALGRKQNLDQRVTDLNQLIVEFGGMIRKSVGERVRVEFAPGTGIEHVLVDHGQIGQVLLNLTLNARDAMPGGGVVTIATVAKDVLPAELATRPDLRPGRYVCVSVSDTGSGMSEEVRGKLFEPFFTTKSPGKGTGLGLATSYGIARQHGGWIDVASAPGRGSCFSVHLPALDRGAEPEPRTVRVEAAAAAPVPPTAPADGLRVLLVEDEETIRALLTRQLERIGYRVTAAPDVTSARAAFSASQERFDLVLTDVVLPDGSGIDLIEILERIRPGFRVLVSSGYTDNEKRWPRIREHGWKFLAKPYTQSELMQALEELRRDTPGSQGGSQS